MSLENKTLWILSHLWKRQPLNASALWGLLLIVGCLSFSCTLPFLEELVSPHLLLQIGCSSWWKYFSVGTHTIHGKIFHYLKIKRKKKRDFKVLATAECLETNWCLANFPFHKPHLALNFTSYFFPKIFLFRKCFKTFGMYNFSQSSKLRQNNLYWDCFN